MKVKVLLECFSIIAIVGLGGCKNPNSKSYDQNKDVASYIENIVKNHDFSGIVLIGNCQEILSVNTAGYSDFTAQNKHSLESRFAIASLSKTFTSGAILHLKSKGKLRLSDTVSTYLPDFPNGDKITVLHLLRHESGLDNVDYDALQNQWLDSKELLTEIGKKPLLFEPGANGRYSNAGFSVLAIIVEKLTGRKFEDYLKQEFFNHLDMQNTGDLTSYQVQKNISKAYFPDAPPKLIRELKNINFSLTLGSGSLYSNAEDLWKWGVSIIEKKNTFDFFEEDYPYGWGQDSIAGVFTLNQTGMLDGSVSSLFLFPEEKVVIVLLSNIQNGMWVDWTKDIAKLFFNKPSEVAIPSKRVIIKDSKNEEKYRDLTGTYILNEDRYVDVKLNAEKGLFIYLNGDDTGHYLTPIAENTFDLRSFTGELKFIKKDTMEWVLPKAWGGQSEFYLKRN